MSTQTAPAPAPATVQVSWISAGLPPPESLLDLVMQGGVGILTAAHASSSYGLPVVVVVWAPGRAPGSALGPAEVGALRASQLNPDIDDGGPAELPLSAAQLALVEAARRAGYDVDVIPPRR
jgi:hypothetical protein